MALRSDAEMFITPKPTRLIERILESASDHDSLDPGFLRWLWHDWPCGLEPQQRRPEQTARFILVEMEPKICRDITAERVRRVAEGYTNAKGEHVEGLGGGFRFCELGEPLFDADGKIRETVTFAELARHVYFTETGEPLPSDAALDTPFLAACRGVGIYLLYNGILGDRSEEGGNILTRAVLAQLPPFDGQKVIYCAGHSLGRDRLQAERIVIRQTPYEIKVS